MFRHFQDPKTKFSHDPGPKSKSYNITPQKEACSFCSCCHLCYKVLKERTDYNVSID